MRGDTMQRLKKRADGRYRCKYKDKEFYGATQEEALIAREQYKDLIKAGLREDSGEMTVRRYSAKFLPTHKTGIRKDTYNTYAHYLDQVNDIIGDMPVIKVTPTDIKSVYNQFIGMSDSTIKKVKMLVTSMFKYAVADGYARSNPCDDVIPAEGYSGSHRAITDEERQWILDTPSEMRLAVLVMLYAGLRRGEVLALDMDSVDFKNNLIYVTTAVSYEGNKRTIKDPKTKAGTRAVPLFKTLQDELKGHEGLIFPKELSRSGFRKAWLKYVSTVETRINGVKKRWYGRRKEDKQKDPLKVAKVSRLEREAKMLAQKGKTKEAEEKAQEAEALRLEGWKSFTVRPHDLRHSFVQMLCDAKVEIDLAMKWVGHGNEKMIRQIYDHVSDYRSDKAVTDVEQVITDRWK